MTARLREVLRETADSVDPYDLYLGALTRAQRRRHRMRVVAAAVAVLVIILSLVLPWELPGRETLPASPSGTPSLPDRVGAPLWGTGMPKGPASMVFAAPDWWIQGTEGELAVVGAHDDTYGVVYDDEHLVAAGEQAVLSPDGSRLATVDEVIDLGTGERTVLPALDGDRTIPQVWSPDGRSLAVIAYREQSTEQPDTDVPVTAKAALYVVDTGAGTARHIDDLLPNSVHDGYMVAFAPDGLRLAYYTTRKLTVVSLAGGSSRSYQIVDEWRLAGKGAWTADGTGITLLHYERCCIGAAFRARWTMDRLDLATGEVIGPEIRLDGLAAVRLLGWLPTGEAAVVASRPQPGAEPAGFDPGNGELGVGYDGFTDYQRILAAEVWAVKPGATRALLTAPDLMMLSVDVADDVITGGLTRTGHPPQGLGPYLRIALTMLIVVVVGMPGAVVMIIRIRRRRRAR